MFFNKSHKKSNFRQIAKFDLNDCTDYYIFLKCLEWIIQEEYDLAYRLCYRYNYEKSIPSGINYDWNKRYHDGISNALEEACINVMSSSSDCYISASAIYSFFSGKAIWNVSKMLNRFHSKYNTKENCDKIMYISSLLSDSITFDSYKEMNVEQYRFLATLDEDTCPICGKLDGQVFDLKAKRIGVNCPPMHKGCRCTTISANTPKCTDTRFARDSNGRGIKVPASMNWEMWKEQYLKKE